MNRSLTVSLTLLFGSLVVSTPCFAGPKGEASVAVRYDDLDLSRPEGMKVLKRRIESTAKQACFDAAGVASSEQLDLACWSDAVAAAWSQIRDTIAQQQSSKSPAVAAAESPPASHRH